MAEPLRILVVCTANICRSPMGELILRETLRGSSVEVSSAGTMAVDGNAADETVRELVVERGWGSLEDHRSRVLMPSMVMKSNLVLCMEYRHLDQIARMSPTLMGKVKLLGHWLNTEIDDPIGRSRDRYAACLDVVERAAARWKEKLRVMGLIA